MSQPDRRARAAARAEVAPAAEEWVPHPVTVDPTRAVPPRALLLSLAALLVPVASALVVPEVESESTLLPWITALIPGFLLSYYRGWTGSALALAGGMAAIPLWALIAAQRGLAEPNFDRIFVLVAGYIAFCVGLGVMTELLLRERRKAQAQALIDPLTLLPNARHADVFLDAAIGSARASGAPLSVVIFNVDRFRWLMDTHGRGAGNHVIRAIADMMRLRLQPEWLCGRIGEDELLVVLPHSTTARAMRFAESVREGVNRLGLRWQPLTVSVGVAGLRGSITRPSELVEEARGAAARAKQLGRDRVELAGSRSAGAGDAGPASAGEASRARERSLVARGIVALPAGEREEVRRVLELNGLRVEEHDKAEQVPWAGTPEQAPAIVVSAASSGEELSEVVALLDRALHESVARVVFLRDAEPGTPHPHGDGVTVIPGPPSGDRLLPLLSGLLRPASSGQRAAPRVVGPFASALAAVGAPLTAARIIVVEDERPTRVALQRALNSIGFHDVIALEGAEEALVAVVDTPPDLVITDLHMPGMDGFALLEALEPLLEGDGFLPVLVVTGDQEWEHRQRVLRMGAKDFLNKPFDVSELGARVLNLLETRKLHLQMRDTNALLEVRVQQRTRELDLAKDEILFRLARAAEYRDDVTGRHAARVGVAAAVLGEAMGLAPELCDMIRRAAPLHDVGKIGIPDAILLKPGRLTPAEMEIMKRHTIIGGELLAHSSSELIESARVIALTHHERWNGTGYPRGLRGDQIPIEGRLVALADAMDALTHRRPYKPAYPFEEAVARLASESGTAFDPRVIEALRACAFRLRDIVLDGDEEDLDRTPVSLADEEPSRPEAPAQPRS
ncbi:MAG TPA: HD domain-containing phosphohydrolase [Longimicrobiales bacterium]|nr:HD domain-containing phosphohydrolase [Longimicrobiales bacterium]